MDALPRVSVVPDLMAAVFAAAEVALEVDGVNVYDGYGVGEDGGDCLMIGVDDPDDSGMARSAESQQSWAHANGRARDEEGDIRCAAWSWVGDEDSQSVVRERAYAIAAQVAALCRTSTDFGVPGVLWTSFGTRADLTEGNTDQGPVALLLFDIHFRARI